MAQNIPKEWAVFLAREKKVIPKNQKGVQRQPCWVSVLFKQCLNSWLFVNGWDLAVSSRRLQSTDIKSGCTLFRLEKSSGQYTGVQQQS